MAWRIRPKARLGADERKNELSGSLTWAYMGPPLFPSRRKRNDNDNDNDNDNGMVSLQKRKRNENGIQQIAEWKRCENKFRENGTETETLGRQRKIVL